VPKIDNQQDRLKVPRDFRNWFLPFKSTIPPETPESHISPPFSLLQELGEVRNYFAASGTQNDSLLQAQDSLPGACFICQKDVLFEVDRPKDGGEVNWRETVKCPHCKMINRWRACLHLFHEVSKPAESDRIYITETLSPIHQYLSRKFPDVTSSEYFADAMPGQVVNWHGHDIRNEDITRLTFDKHSFDHILSFDVLEHVPEYKKALSEFRHVLKEGGQLILTAPFNFQQETTVRAVVNDEGIVEHLLEPCYHGDPLSDQGVLAYYDFGMALKDDLHRAGFKSVSIACYRSDSWGYPVGGVAFTAR
jgi:SAM-dependent methyltransferase